ncbi:MAG: tetratricopeptide repeat protein [Thermoplasmatota archaeon]
MKTALVLGVLLLLPIVSAAGPGFRFDSATGEGPFSLDPNGHGLVRTGRAVDWRISAVAAHITFVDDHEDNAVPDPLNPPRNLFSVSNRTVTTYDLRAVAIRWTSGELPVSIVQGKGLTNLTVADGLEVRAVPGMAVEHGHYFSDGSIGGQARRFELDVGASVRVNATMDATVSGNVSLYSWSNTLVVQDATGARTIRTGQFTDMPTSQGSLRSEHWAYALLDLEGAAANVTFPEASLYAPNLGLASRGLLRITNATGQIAAQNGLVTASGSSITATDGAFVFLPAGNGLSATVASRPVTVLGAVQEVRPPSLPPILLVAVGLVSAVAVAMSPSVTGRHLRRRHGGHFAGFREDRCTAYRSWAAGADSRGWQRTACILFGRAVRNSPKDPELRCEHAILLRQTGFPRRALKEHVRAAELLAQLGDPGCRAMNAYGASLCAARLRQDESAVEWLQEAVEQDPALMNDARAEPALRRLRAHPDFHAIIRAGA